jgi:hypothetical protein
VAESPAAAWTRSLAERAADDAIAPASVTAERNPRDLDESAGDVGEKMVSRDRGGGEGASTRSPAVGPNARSATMIASDTAWSESDTGWTSGGHDSHGDDEGYGGHGGHGGHGGRAREPAWPASGADRLADQDEHERPYQATHQHWAAGREWAAAQDWEEDDDRDQDAYPELAPRPEVYRHLWQPPGRRPAPRQALGRPYVWDGGRPDPEALTSGRPDVTSEPARDVRPHRHRRPSEGDVLGGGPSPSTERAVLGDHLRELGAWCQIGACIARHTDADALGERDIRKKAVAAGWCVDLFGRLVCPSCQQRYPVWCARPLLIRDRPGSLAPMAAGTHEGRHRRVT